MENSKSLRPLTPMEKQFASDNYHLIMDFLKRMKLNAEEFFDVVVFEFLLSVEIYLNNSELQERCNFEAVSYMYMKRALFVYFRKQKATKRSSEAGADISFNMIDIYVSKVSTLENTLENSSLMEYMETVKQIESNLTAEQRKIFVDKLEGYSLKEIADNNGIKPKRVYKQFGKIKNVVADVMEVQQLYG